MINPAHVQASAVGVANERMAPLVAGVLAKRGSRGLVFRGNDGLDELTTTGPSRVWEIRNGAVAEEMLDPRDLGIRQATLEELRGGTPRPTPPSSGLSCPALRARPVTPPC